jgi:DNA-binding CsgD family transcriptional regulator
MTTAVVVVDDALCVMHANRAAEELARGPGAVLRRENAGLCLGASHAEDAVRLAARVREVALAGGSGGAVRLRRPGGEGAIAALVMPLPTMLRGRALGGASRALVLLRDPDRVVLPGPDLLCELYDLTRAEAAVALAIGAGETAERIASGRGVSENTVRVQIRAVLAKTNAGSVRGLARILASLPGI